MNIGAQQKVEDLIQRGSSTVAPENRRVLLVDDDLHFRLSTACILANRGYQVSEAANDADALAIILDSQQQGNPFDLLITDILPPKTNGLTLLKNLIEENISIPVLVISGYLTADTIKELHQISCREILVKPFKPEEFQERVARLTSSTCRRSVSVKPTKNAQISLFRSRS